MPEKMSQKKSIVNPKIECRAVWKVFGDKADADIKSMTGATVDEITRHAQNHGGIVGACDVSFTVGEGELFVIMGLSGSGKSTVLRCIAQLQKTTLGSVMLDGVDLAQCSDAELMEIRRRKMGMVFQNFGLVPHFTALENIAFPLKIRGDSANFCRDKAQEMLELVGLNGRGDSYPKELSGGQQQRVGIARSLAVDPELWLLDEPYSALDPLIRRQLQDELLDLQAGLKKSIVFITHDFDEAVKLADKIAIMRDGMIVQQGTAAELLMHPADDYVKSFVSDVARLQVLKLKDIMTPAKTKPNAALPMQKNGNLETALLAMPDGAGVIAVMDGDKLVGKVSRKDITAAVNLA